MGFWWRSRLGGQRARAYKARGLGVQGWEKSWKVVLQMVPKVGYHQVLRSVDSMAAMRNQICM